MKKFFKILMCILSLFLFVGILASCGEKKDPTDKTSTPTVEVPTVEVETDQKEVIYNMAVASGYTGTYEEWLKSISGDEIELSLKDNYIVWKYKSELTWRNLVSLAQLQGKPGMNGLPGQAGTPGKDGVDGKTPEFRVSNGYLQWKYTTDTNWINLYEISTGEAADPDSKDIIKVTFVTEWEWGGNDAIIPLEYEVIEVPKGNIKEPTVTKEGYYIDSWFYYDKYDKYYQTWKFDYYSAAEDLVLYAEYKPYYTVTFKDPEGNIIDSFEVKNGDIVKCPEVEVSEGCKIRWLIDGENYSFDESFDFYHNKDLSITYIKVRVGTSDYDLPISFDTETPVTVTFWNTMGKNLQEPLNEAIDEFQALYPNVTIESEQIGSYDDVRDQVITNMGTGDYPSMAYCYPDHVALYNEADITVSLGDIIYDKQYGFGGEQVKFEGPKQEDFVAGFWAEGSQYEDGKTYTMPFLKSTEALFYNKSFFETNKLAVPTTWEEVWATCAKIKEIDPYSTPLGYDSESNLFITLAEAYGYDYTKAYNDYFYFNNEGMRGLMKEFKQYFDKGYFTTGELCGGYTNTLMTDTTQTSKAYMCIGSTAGASYQVNSDGLFETGVTAVPTAAGKELKCMSQGPSIVFFKKANPQEVLAAWLFTQYLLTPETQAKFAFVSGYLPVTKTATATSYYQAFLAKAYKEDGSLNNIKAAACKQAVAQSNNYFALPVFIGSSTARDQVGSLVVRILGDKSMTADNMDSKIQGYFDAAIQECRYQAGL